MGDKKLKVVCKRELKTLHDEEIVTRPIGRRSFLSRAGTLLFGMTAIATQSGLRKGAAASNDSDNKDPKKSDGKKDSDENRMADPHLPGDHKDSGWDDPDTDMRKWADKKKDSD